MALLRQDPRVGSRTRFVRVNLLEPDKDLILARAEEQVERQTLAVLLDNATGGTYEAIVSLTSGAICDFPLFLLLAERQRIR